MDNLKTIVTTSDYRDIKGVELDEELNGTSDENEGDGIRFIFRVEQKIFNFLSEYAFNEKMLEDEKCLEMFKLAVCEQIEDDLAKGMDNPVNDRTKGFLYRGSMLTLVGW